MPEPTEAEKAELIAQINAMDDDDDEGHPIDLMPDPDDSEDAEILQVRPAPAKKRRGRPRKTQTIEDEDDRILSRRLRARNDEAYDEYLEKLDFGPDQHKVSIYRLEPVFDPRTGAKIKGLLQTFNSPVGQDEIQQLYGGGTYEVKIMGPDPRTGKGNKIKTIKRIEIAGPPIVRGMSDSSNGESGDTKLEVLQTLIDAKDRDAQRAYEKADKSERLLLQLLSKDNGSKDMMQMFMGMMNEQRTKDDSAVQLMLAEMREERKRQDELHREEMRRRDEKADREREDRRREQEERDRRYREDQAELQRRHEKEMMELQLRIKESVGSQQENMGFMLNFLEKKQQEDKERSADMLQMQFGLMQEGSRQSVDMLTQTQQMQTTLLMEALKEAKATKKGDSIGEVVNQISGLMSVKNMITGEGESTPESTAERIFDKAKEALPSLGDAVAKVLVARGGGGHPGMGYPPQRQLPPASSMAFVDQGPVEEPPDQHPPQPEQRNMQQPSPAEQPAPENDFTEFVFPNETDDLTTQITCLIKDLDLAIRREMDPKSIVQNIVDRFPKKVLFFIENSSVDELIQFIEARVPTNWMIVSPQGDETIRAMHKVFMETR